MIEELIKRIVFDEDTLKKRIKELGEAITRDFQGEDLVVIGILKGSIYFFTDLTRCINLPIEVDMMGFGNIPGTTSKTGVVRITKDIDVDITGKNVLLIEDVIRTGLTTCYLSSSLESKKPKSISVCSLFLNSNRMIMTMPIKYHGFEIDDSWLIGYGMDINERGRNLPYVAEIKKEASRHLS